MHLRPIPSSGETIGVIGLGTWQTFDVDSPAQKKSLEAVTGLLITHGGRMIDSSPMYGRAEGVVGEVTGGRSDLFLATKVWTRGREAGVAQMEASRRLMRREVLDLIQIHNLVDWRKHLATLRAWKEAGKVRYIGVTHYQPSAFGDLEQILKDEAVDFVQLPYSAGVRDAEERLLPLAVERRVGVIVNRPFEEAALLRSVRGRTLPDWAGQYDATSWPELFLKFIVAHPAVTCVIPATRSAEHMKDNLRAGESRLLTRNDRAELGKRLRTG
jgi:diketogulonate reductase-like aldo/keto reductase